MSEQRFNADDLVNIIETTSSRVEEDLTHDLLAARRELEEKDREIERLTLAVENGEAFIAANSARADKAERERDEARKALDAFPTYTSMRWAMFNHGKAADNIMRAYERADALRCDVLFARAAEEPPR